jgi:hypothetical protein
MSTLFRDPFPKRIIKNTARLSTLNLCNSLILTKTLILISGRLFKNNINICRHKKKKDFNIEFCPFKTVHV